MEHDATREHSLACRECHRGWMGEPGEKCKGCGKESIETGEFETAFLPFAPAYNYEPSESRLRGRHG